MNPKSISIIGYGRFGQTLYRLLKGTFPITLYTRNQSRYQEQPPDATTTITQDLETAYQSDVIFYCTPIETFEQLIQEHLPYIKSQHLLIDTLSVKLHPKSVFEKLIDTPSGRQSEDLPQTESTESTEQTEPTVLLSHPMFGPDSSKNGFQNLPIVLDQFTSTQEQYKFWKETFTTLGLKIVEMSAEEHDKLAAKSQGTTHFIGRILDKINFTSTQIDTQGAKKLGEIKQQTCNDTYDLFKSLQSFNPYTPQMRSDFINAAYQVSLDILPEQIDPQKPTFGIQGGPGSFNQQALEHYTSKHNITDYHCTFLYTTAKVLEALFQGQIDFGQFAIENSVGGMVTESMQAMAQYRFQIIEEFAFPIQHHLMKLPTTKNERLTTIMAHPQVLKQCKQSLEEKYAHLKLQSGEGDLIDTAQAAKALSEGNLSPDTAILGPRALNTLYNLEIIDQNLQDDHTNNTTFLIVKR